MNVRASIIFITENGQYFGRDCGVAHRRIISDVCGFNLRVEVTGSKFRQSTRKVAKMSRKSQEWNVLT